MSISRKRKIVSNEHGQTHSAGNTIEDAYRELCMAIVILACNDYMKAIVDCEKGKQLTWEEDSAMTFFESDLPEYFCEIPSEIIVKSLIERIRGKESFRDEKTVIYRR